MPTLTISGKIYEVDEVGFLLDSGEWDEEFAIETASDLGIRGGLTDDHWRVIRYIHRIFHTEGRCPLVFQTCKANELRLKDLSALFPTGYLRGACKLAGITYREGELGYGSIPSSSRQFGTAPQPAKKPATSNRHYTIDIRGFLVDASQWDEHFAAMRAAELKMPRLTDRHWRTIRYMRGFFEEHGVVPTVYETCASNELEIDDLAALFPDGYHRGAVKLAGLRVI